MVKDLTSGSPLKIIVKFAIPIILGNIVQQLYSWSDAMMVGKLIGNSALAAVGATAAINFFILGFLMGIAEGAALIVARFFGSGDYTALRRCIGNIVYVCISITVLLTVLALIFNRGILTLLNTPGDIIDDAEKYLRVIYLGMIATMLYNLCAGIMRALGDSKTPLYFLIASSILNIFLNYIFIVVIPLGVTGAAIATVVSQLLSGTVSLIVIVKRYDVIRLSRDDLKLRCSHVSKILLMSLPMAFQYSITAIGTLFLQTAINNLGSDCVAAFTVGEKVWVFCWSALNCIGVALASFCSQNIGASKLNRVKKGVRSTSLLVLAITAVMTAAMLLFGKYIALIFLEEKTDAIMLHIETYFLVQTPFLIALAAIGVFRNVVMGLGYTLQGMLAGVLELIGRTVISLILVDYIGFAACCLASPIAWILADCLLIPLYFYIVRKLSREHPEWLLNEDK